MTVVKEQILLQNILEASSHCVKALLRNLCLKLHAQKDTFITIETEPH